MRRNILLGIITCVFIHHSFSQSQDSIDKALKYNLIKSIEPVWLVSGENTSIVEYQNFFKPIYLNSDTLVDMIYYGPSGSEDFETQIYLNRGKTLHLIKRDLGSIKCINKPYLESPAEILFSPIDLEDDRHKYFQKWTLFYDEIEEGDKYRFLSETEIPDYLSYKFSIKIMSSNYALRATPEIIKENFHDQFERGNIIAEYTDGDIGHVLSSKKDATGRTWYFVIMERPIISGYHSSEMYADQKWLGWISGRYVQIINEVFNN
jgi:hypothetical protein